MPGSAHSPPSPQLEFEWGSYEDTEKSFNMLAKLRGRAFGGSSTSINSPGPGSSPLALHSSPGLPFIDYNNRMGSSIHSLSGSAGILESEEEDDDHIELPTLTQNTPRKKRLNLSPVTPSNHVTMSPCLSPSERSKICHNRTGSGADRVSYVKDPDGSGRWLLERRRTGDD